MVYSQDVQEIDHSLMASNVEKVIFPYGYRTPFRMAVDRSEIILEAIKTMDLPENVVKQYEILIEIYLNQFQVPVIKED